MPKITRKFYKFQSTHIPVDICYSENKHFYAKGVPEDVLRLDEGLLSGFDTEEELFDSLRKIFQSFHEKIKKSRKVIVYSFNMTSELYMKKISYGFEGCKSWVPRGFVGRRSHYGESDGYGFGIEWEVLMEVKAEETTYHKIQGDGSLGYKQEVSGKTMIDWTPEREEALKEVYVSIEEMVKRIVKVLADPKSFIKMLDSGTKLLPYKPEKGGKYGKEKV